MDELLRDFLAESAEQLEAIGVQLTRFELHPTDARITADVYRLIHAIKGACGFLNLPRLENIAHAAEDLIGWMSDDSSPKGTAVSLVLEAFDRMRFILAGLAEGHDEPLGDDSDLIARFEAATTTSSASRSACCGEGAILETPICAASTPPRRRLDTVRVSAKSIERMTALVSDLVVTRNQLLGAAAGAASDPIRVPLQRLSKIAAELQSSVLAARMQPIDRLFDNLKRFAHDVGADLGKRVELSLQGGETLLDRQVIATVRESLAKLIRNAVDHGIESPGDRCRSGKPDFGLIKISARQDAGHVVIEVCDDGRGLDAGFRHERACASGRHAHEFLNSTTESGAYRPDAAPDSSTSRCCSAGSGQSGGLDIVRAGIEEIGGSVALASQVGQGATIALRIPLTAMVVPALIVVAGADRFALPQHAVEELVEIDSNSNAFLEDTQGGLVLRVGNHVTPAARLSLLMRSMASIGAPLAGAPLGLRLRAGAEQFAIVVDAIADVQEIAVKSLPRQVRHMALFSDCAILNDGSAVLLLNPDGLAEALGLSAAAGAHVASFREQDTVRACASLVTIRHDGASMALPLSAVENIQPVATRDMNVAKGGRILRFRNVCLPVIDVDYRKNPATSIPPIALILKQADRHVAAPADEIADIEEGTIDLDSVSSMPKAVGGATVCGESIEILNAFQLLDQVVPRDRANAADPRRTRLLVIEEVAVLRQMLDRILTRAGYEVEFAIDLGEALHAARHSPGFDGALADIEHIAITGTLKEDWDALRGAESIRVVALAAHSGEGVQKVARRAGFVASVGKFDRLNILNTLRSSGLESERRGAAA